MPKPRILFQTFNRRGLGHLMRGLNIARELLALDPDADVMFYTHGDPPTELVAGIRIEFHVASSPGESGGWRNLVDSVRPHVIVFDTMLPQPGQGASKHRAKLVYIMRKCLAERQKEVFSHPVMHSVESIIVPHTRQEFGHDVPRSLQSKVRFVGTIVRRPNSADIQRVSRKYALRDGSFVLVSTPGGGGFLDEANAFLRSVTEVHRELRAVLGEQLQHLIVKGPKYLGSFETPPGASVIESEPDLVSLLACADLVISAGGYNTVNEIRATKTPAVFLPSPRSHDDQRDRVVGLASAGLAFVIPNGTPPAELVQKVSWLCQNRATLAEVRRRYMLDAMPVGNWTAAKLILDLASR